MFDTAPELGIIPVCCEGNGNGKAAALSAGCAEDVKGAGHEKGLIKIGFGVHV